MKIVKIVCVFVLQLAVPGSTNQGKMLGGQPVGKYKDFPEGEHFWRHMGAIETLDFPYVLICGASFISERTLFTIGTCVSTAREPATPAAGGKSGYFQRRIDYEPLNPETLQVRYGTRWLLEDYNENFYLIDNPGERFDRHRATVEKIILHPEMLAIDNFYTPKFNIGIVKMSTTYVTSVANTMGLESSSPYVFKEKVEQFKRTKETCKIFGWGRDWTFTRKYGWNYIPVMPKYSTILRTLDVYMDDQDTCERLICTKDADMSICKTDRHDKPSLKSIYVGCAWPKSEVLPYVQRRALDQRYDFNDEHDGPCIFTAGDLGGSLVCEESLYGLVLNQWCEPFKEWNAPILFVNVEAIALMYNDFAFGLDRNETEELEDEGIWMSGAPATKINYLFSEISILVILLVLVFNF